MFVCVLSYYNNATPKTPGRIVCGKLYTLYTQYVKRDCAGISVLVDYTIAFLPIPSVHPVPPVETCGLEGDYSISFRNGSVRRTA